jgi:acetolactate synthase-1/3 small subunit
VTVTDETRSEVLSIIDIFRGKVVDVSSESYTVEITGDENKVHAILDLFRPMGIKDIARTGCAALTRGSKVKSSKGTKSKK